MTYWRNDPAFEELSNAIASDRLVVFTGAGISNGLLSKQGVKIGGWQELLGNVSDRLPLSTASKADVQSLLATDGQSSTVMDLVMGSNAKDSEKRDIELAFKKDVLPAISQPNGPELIEVAEALESQFPQEFVDLVTEFLTPADIQESAIAAEQASRHAAILDLLPRGIITLNIDGQHRKQIESQRPNETWTYINPTILYGPDGAEQKTRKWLADQSRTQLLLEAHGALDAQSDIVFTYRSYRDLIERNPAYLSLMGFLLTNYRVIFVGFGLSDLDFDRYLLDSALSYGIPPQPLLTIRRSTHTASELRQEIRLRRRFNMSFLNLESHRDVWEALSDAGSVAGATVSEVIRLCVSSGEVDRRLGHEKLNRLGQAGKALAADEIIRQLDNNDKDSHEYSELLYSLGFAGNTNARGMRRVCINRLLLELEQSNNTECLAHSVSALEHIIEVDDVEALDRAAHSVIARRTDLYEPPGFMDPDQRVLVYLEAAVLRLRAKILANNPGSLQQRVGQPLVD